MDTVLPLAIVALLVAWMIDGWRTDKWIGELEHRVKRLEEKDDH